MFNCLYRISRFVTDKKEIVFFYKNGLIKVLKKHILKEQIYSEKAKLAALFKIDRLI